MQVDGPPMGSMTMDGMVDQSMPSQAMASPEVPIQAMASPDMPLQSIASPEMQMQSMASPDMHMQSMASPDIPVQSMASPEMAVQEAPVQNYEGQKHMDQTMDVDDSMNNTITASTIAPLPEFQSQSNTAYANEPHRPQTSYSDTTYSTPQYAYGNQDARYGGSRFNSPSDADTPPRHGYYNGQKETQMGQSNSRPNSTLGFRPHSADNANAGTRYQEQNQRSSQPQQDAAAKNTSVVIKVGMVGDAQIGKTSLMVKYVEGSWDEDYIQTLGELRDNVTQDTVDFSRCQLHGKDHIHSQHRNYLFHLGSRRPARVR